MPTARRRSWALVAGAAVGVAYLWMMMFIGFMSLSGDCFGSEQECQASFDLQRQAVVTLTTIELGLTALATLAVKFDRRWLSIALFVVSGGLLTVAAIWAR